MRSVSIAASLVLALMATPGLAQAPSPPAVPPAQQPAQPPRAQTAAPPPQPPAPFPQGARIGIVNLQAIAEQSTEGKSSTAQIQALIQKKQAEGAAKNKALQDNQNKLAQSGALMNEAARAQLEKDIERQQVETQRFQQDAQAEINELQTDLQNEFQRKLFPILEQVRKEKELHVLLSAQESGVVAIDPGIDLTSDVITRFDAAVAPRAAAPAAAAPPAQPAAAPPAAPPPSKP